MQDTLFTRAVRCSNIVFCDYGISWGTLCRPSARATTTVDSYHPREPVPFEPLLVEKMILAYGVLGH